MKDIKIPELEAIKKKVETEMGLKDISAPTNKREVITGRAMYYDRARELTEFSLASIGEYVGKDHAGAIHGIKKLQEYLRRFPQFKVAWNNIIGNGIETDFEKILEDNKKLEQENRKLEEQVRQLKKKRYKASHYPIFKILDDIPEYHVETVRVRLEPIVKMLEKPCRYNRFKFQEQFQEN